jgi:hypothetical protein
MNASKTLRLALSAGALLLALHSTTPGWADTYQDRFCQLSKNLDVPGKSSLSTEMASFASAFAAMRSFFIAFAVTDTQRDLASTLLAQGKTVLNFLNKNLNTGADRKMNPITWDSADPSVGAFAGRVGQIHDKVKAALDTTEGKIAAALKKASSVGRWETVIKSQTHSADTSALKDAEAAAMAEPQPVASYAKFFRPLVFVQYALQTYPAMLDVLRTATSAICTQAKGMKAGGFVKTAADEYTDYLAQAAADFTRLEAFVRTWAPKLKSVASDIQKLEAGLAPVKTVADNLVTALTPFDGLPAAVDASMTETVCSQKKDLCVNLADFPATLKSWGVSKTKLPTPSQTGVMAAVWRRMKKLFGWYTNLPNTTPDFSPLDKAADGVGTALGTLDSFFTALEGVIDIPMEGEANALNAISAELTAQKLTDD